MSTHTSTQMHAAATEAALKKTVKVQGNMMPLGEWIIATRWAWNYERDEMGYTAYLYRYTTAERGTHAPIMLVLDSSEDFDDFHTQADAGGWALGMILAYE